MTVILTKTSRSKAPRRKDKPFYGWRFVERPGTNGHMIMEKQLLTLEEALHPREGDQIPQSSIHYADECYLFDVCHAREALLENGLVLADCIIDWGIAGLGNHCADISVFNRLKVRPPDDIGTFRLRLYGGRCLLIVEIVSPASPKTRKNDVTHKLREYHRARVPLYIIVDQKKRGGPRELLAYRYQSAGYVKRRLDSQGRILIRSLGIRLGLKENRVVCYDAQTDQELGDYAEQAQARQAAERAQRAAEERVKELETELRRLRGESD